MAMPARLKGMLNLLRGGIQTAFSPFTRSKKKRRNLVLLALFVLFLACACAVGFHLFRRKRALSRLRREAVIHARLRQYAKAAESLKEALRLDPGDSATHLLLGKVLQDAGDVEGSEKAYARVLEINPGFLEVYISLAALYITANKPEKAKEILNTFREKAGGRSPMLSSQAECLQGSLHERAGDVEAARKAYARARALWRESIPPRMALARLHFRADELSEAARAYGAVLDINPLYWEAIVRLTGVLERQENLDKACRILERFLEKSPGHYLATLRLGELLLKKGDLERAEAIGDSISKIQPGAPYGTLLKAEAMLKGGRTAEAAGLFAELSSSNPGLREAYCGMARAAIASGDVEGCETNCLKALKVDPNYAAVQTLLAELCILKRDYAGAIQWARKALKRSRPTGRLLAALFKAFSYQRKFVEAKKEFDALVRKHPHNKDAGLYLCLANLLVRDLDEVIRLSEKLLKDAPLTPKAYDLLTLAYLMKREALLAIKELHRLADEDPRFYLARFSLSKIYIAIGRHDLAAEEFRAVLIDIPDQEEARYGLARMYILQGQFLKASRELEMLVNQVPESVKYREVLALSYQMAGDSRSALKVLGEILSRDASYWPAREKRIAIFLDSGRFEEAEKELLSAKARHPRFSFFYNLGLLYFYQGKFPRAAEILEAAHKEFRNPKAFFPLAALYGEMGRVEKALDIYRNTPFIRDMPNRFYRLLFVNLHLLAGRTDEAKKIIEKAPGWDAELRNAYLNISKRTESAKSADATGLPWQTQLRLFNRILVYRRTGWAKPCLETAEKLASGTRNLFLLFFLTEIFQEGGRGDRAIELLQAIAEAYPDCSKIYFDLGRAYKSRRLLRRALKILREGVKEFPESLRLRLILGETCAAANLRKEAIQHYEKAIALEPRSGLAYNNLAWIYMKEGEETDKALQLALKAKELLPGNSRVLDTLGLAYFRAGDHKKALQYCEMARNAQPREIEIRYHLAEIFTEQGEVDRARAELELAFLVVPESSIADTGRQLLKKLKRIRERERRIPERAEKLDLEKEVTGRLLFESSMDSYHLEIEKEERIDLLYKGPGDRSTEIRILKRAGKEKEALCLKKIDVARGERIKLAGWTAAPGSYYFAVANIYEGGKERYRLQVRPAALPEEPGESEINDLRELATPLPVGSVLFGSIGPGRDRDYFKLPKYHGERSKLPKRPCRFSFQAPEGVVSLVRFFALGSQGSLRLLKKIDLRGGEELILDRFYPLDHEMYILIEGKSSGERRYTLSLKEGAEPEEGEAEINDLPDMATPLFPGTILGAAIDHRGDTDYYRLETEKGGAHHLDLCYSGMEKVSALIKFLRRRGKELVPLKKIIVRAGESARLVNWRVGGEGYYISVSSVGRAIKNRYTLRLDRTKKEGRSADPEINDTRDLALPISVPADVSGLLIPRRDRDWYRLGIPKGEGFVRFQFRPPLGMETKLVFWRKSGIRGLVAEPGKRISLSAGKPLQMDFWNPEGKQVFLEIRGGEGSTARYRLELTHAAPASGGQEIEFNDTGARANPIEPGVPVHGSINYDRDYDWFRFRIREERKITAIVFHGLKKCDGELRLLHKIRSGLAHELKRYVLHAGDTLRLKGLDLSAGDYFIEVSATGGGGEEYYLKIDR
jgi:tetratricopeptide (TPR) repeat protein